MLGTEDSSARHDARLVVHREFGRAAARPLLGGVPRASVGIRECREHGGSPLVRRLGQIVDRLREFVRRTHALRIPSVRSIRIGARDPEP